MKNNLQKAGAVFFLVIGLFLTSITKAQNNYSGYPNENASAISIPINARCNIASDSYGNIFIADADNNRVLVVNTNGIISTFAGTGTPGYWGDGGMATAANLNYPSSVAIDASGNVFIADTKNNRVRMVNSEGIITTIAGNGAQGYSGDGNMAIYASLNEPNSVAVDAYKNVYIADNYNNRIRMVNGSSGIIYTIAGNGASVYQGSNVATASVLAPVTYQSYYDELSPYGQWVNSPQYGTIWVPSAGPDFVPYSTAGHWVYTSYGWTWVSDYSWGWCAFHYGTWDYDDYLGWFWVPGNEWALAWVSWRSGNGYYGWAPLPPAYGTVSTTNSYVIPMERYVFVQNQYITSPEVYNYYAPREQTITYVNNTTIINRTYYDNDTRTTCYSGPPKEEVEKYTNAPVKEVVINSSDKPGQYEDRTNGTLTIYRPKVQNPPASANTKAPAPAHLYSKEEIKPVAERPVITQPKQNEVTNTPAKTEQPHTDVPINEQPKQNDVNKEPSTNPQPHNEVAPNQNIQQNNNVVHPATNNQQVKQGQPSTQIKDRQVGKDVKGHVIYQDKKGNKYYMNEKGVKVVIMPKPKSPDTTTEPVKPN